MKLVVLNGQMTGTEFPLHEGENTLGRRSNNHIPIPLDPKISRHHARILKQDDVVLLDDINSSNGTFLEQRRIYQPTRMQVGDRFRLGRTWLLLSTVDANALAAQEHPQVVLFESTEAADSEKAQVDNVVFTVNAIQPEAYRADAEEAQRRLSIIIEYTEQLGSILELPVLFGKAVDLVMSALHCEQVVLLLVDIVSGELEPALIRSRLNDNQGEESLRISRKMITQAMNEHVALLTNDATVDERFAESDSVHNLHIRSAIAAPLISHGVAKGVFYLHTSSNTHVFSEQDVRLVAGMAGQTAIAIENARLYTDLRQTYEALQSAQDQLVQNESVATVGMLAASIAHDMANIVTPLSGLIQLMLSGTKLTHEAQEVMQRECQRLVALVQRLLAFSRNNQVATTPTDINRMVNNTLSLVKTEMRHRKIELQLDLQDNLPKVLGDSAQLERVLLNLIINASEALEEWPNREVVITTSTDDDEVIFSVSDKGPGVPLENQALLFEPFFTTKPKGTGLGLYSCRRIVEEEHGGTIELDSIVGSGTTITIRLPADVDNMRVPALVLQ